MLHWILVGLNFIFLVFIFFLVVLRLRSLNRRHIENTGINGLRRAHKKMFYISLVLFVLLFCFSSFIILTLS